MLILFVSYSAYPFQAGLFMVSSAPRLVFVVCVPFSLVFGISCSYFLIFSMSFLPFGIVLVLYFTFSILCGPCFFCMRAPSHILQFVAFLFAFVVAYVFFSATSPSIRKFSSLFLCLFVNVIEVKTLVFSSLFPRALCFLVFYSLGIFKRC